jgi:hypothetical protein
MLPDPTRIVEDADALCSIWNSGAELAMPG